MKHFGLALIAYAALVLQAGWSSQLAAGFVEPAFLPLVLVLVIFGLKGSPAILWAAVVGLLSDCLAAETLGIDMLCATLIAFIARRALGSGLRAQGSALSTQPLALSPPLFVLVSFLVAESMLLFSTAARVVLTGRTIGAVPLLSATSQTAAYTACIALAVLLAGRLIVRVLAFSTSRAKANA